MKTYKRHGDAKRHLMPTAAITVCMVDGETRWADRGDLLGMRRLDRTSFDVSESVGGQRLHIDLVQDEGLTGTRSDIDGSGTDPWVRLYSSESEARELYRQTVSYHAGLSFMTRVED